MRASQSDVLPWKLAFNLSSCGRQADNLILFKLWPAGDSTDARRSSTGCRGMLARRRWFFCKLSGRRRIGKTTLVQQALPPQGRLLVYLQIPDSAPSGVLGAFRDALDVFGVDREKLPPLCGLRSMANGDERVVRFGTIKRDPARLHGSFAALRASAEVFLTTHKDLRSWTRELVAVAPELSKAQRAAIAKQGLLAQDLTDLWTGLEPSP